MRRFTQQELENALRRAPAAVQRELATGFDTAVTIAALGKKFNLHILITEMIAELNRNMLLGLIDAQEFLQDLLAARVPEADARQILGEINQKIITPLRNQIGSEQAKSSAAVPPPPQPVAATRPAVSAQVPRYAPVAPPPPPPPPAPTPPPPPPPQPQRPAPRAYEMPPPSVIITANPAMPTRQPAQSEYITKLPRYTPPAKPAAVPGQFRPAAPAPAQARPSVNVLPQRPPAPAAPAPAMTDATKMLEDHEEAHMELRQPRPSVSRITPPTPAQPPANLPGAMPPPPPRPFPTPTPQPRPFPPVPPARPASPTPPPAPRPFPPIQPPPPTPPSGPHTDPYREPVDEN